MKGISYKGKLIILIYVMLFSVGTKATNTTTTCNTSIKSGVNVVANVDYVLTLTSPFSGSGYINIPSASMEHSVVIFKAIKPSVVIKDWLSHIRINGETAVNGTNCQVRMYNKGAIVLPYSSSFKPLTCYSGTNYTETSCTNYSTGSNGGYMKTLTQSTLLNNIRSFKLKRGYMVTFATGTGGWGYSRCFIAATEDLEMNLPTVLNGKVSSYRLFEWYNFGKSGIANNTDANACDALNVQSAYTYGTGRDMRPDVECIPHKIHKNWPAVGDCGSCDYSAHIKTDNEPANSNDDEPATVAEVLAYWQDAMRTGMRLCAPSSHDGGYAWQEEFMKAIDERGWRCDILDLHCYWVTGSFYSLINYFNKYHRPIWVTEWLWGASWNGGSGMFSGNPSAATINSETSTILNCMNSYDYVERYYYWNGESKGHIYENGVTSPLGQTYAATDGGLGYNAAKEFVPVVVISRPYSLSGSVSGSSISLSWKDKNGDMMDEIRIQYKTPSASSWNTLKTVERKDKTGSGDQSYTFNGTLANAENYWWRVADIYENTEYSSYVLMPTPVLVSNSKVLPANLSDFYFQFYSKEASTSLVWAVYGSGTENRVYYKAANSNYADDLYQLWTLEPNSNGGFSLRNVGVPDYLIASPYSWNFVTRNDNYKVEDAKTAFDFTYDFSGEYWTCKNLAHNMYVGLWDNDKNFAAGEVLAGNRTNASGTDSGDKLGIRIIPRNVVNETLGIVTIPSGRYYLYNNESGLFVAGGNKWDTQAIGAETGLDFAISPGTNGYTLDSNVSNGGDSHYLGSNLYVDGNPVEWTFAKAGTINGKQAYTISNEGNYLSAPTKANTALTTTTNASSASAKWLLLKRNDLMDMLDEATYDNPVNATFLLPGARFGRNDGRISNWNGTPTRGGYANSDWGDYCGEKFNTTFDVCQIVTDAPDGVYEVSMQGFYRNGGYNDAANLRKAGNEALNALLYGNDKTMPLPSIFSEAGKCSTQGVNQSIYGYIPNGMTDASHYIHAGLYATGPLRFTVSGGQLQIGVMKTVAVANDWTIFDNFRLTYLGPAIMTGDVNHDGTLTITDVTALVSIILGKDNTLPHCYDHTAADVNGDQNVTIADITALMNLLLKR